eukprot:SAG31_NODE_3092_length_4683_cov_2.003927_3_plen_98_part_00
MCIIQEYMPNGDLGSFLRSNDAASKLTLEARLNMAVDTASGMEYLHSKTPPIIHRDLKSPNLLLDHAMRVGVFAISCSYFLWCLCSPSNDFLVVCIG